MFPLEGFTKVKVYDGVGLVIKEGPNYEVKIVTNDKSIDNIIQNFIKNEITTTNYEDYTILSHDLKSDIFIIICTCTFHISRSFVVA